MRTLTVDLRRAARAVKRSLPVRVSTNSDDSDEKYDVMPNITGASHVIALLIQVDIICAQVPTTPLTTVRGRVRVALSPRI
jgi:hypothetical protein